MKKISILLALLLIITMPGVAASSSSEIISSTSNPVSSDVPLRNNPFTYHYETTPLVLLRVKHFTQKQAYERDYFAEVIAKIFESNKYTFPLSIGVKLYNAINPTHMQAGTLKVWKGEKKQIATSGITGKSHVVNRWLIYRTLYIGEDGRVLLDQTGSVRQR